MVVAGCIVLWALSQHVLPGLDVLRSPSLPSLDYGWAFRHPTPRDFFETFARRTLLATDDGKILKRLTDAKGYDAEATVCAKDGSIVFTSTRDGDIELYRMDADGGNPTNLLATRLSPTGQVLGPKGFRLNTNGKTQSQPAVAFNGIEFLVIWIEFHQEVPRLHEAALLDQPHDLQPPSHRRGGDLDRAFGVHLPRAVHADLELSLLAILRSGECTPFVAKQLGFGPQAGFVNALLRGYIRELDATRAALEDLRSSQPHLGFSHPEWLVKRWTSHYGAEATRQLLEWNNTPPHTFARVNTLKGDAATLLPQWRNENVEYDFVRRDWIKENLAFELKSHPPLHRLPSFQQGRFYIQDPSTLLAARELGAILRPLGDVIVLMPPLCITLEELDRLCEITAAAIARGTA